MLTQPHQVAAKNYYYHAKQSISIKYISTSTNPSKLKTGKILAGLPIKQHPTPEHRAYAISLKFHSCEQSHQADCLTPSLRGRGLFHIKLAAVASNLNIPKQS